MRSWNMICLMNIMYMCDELAWSVPTCFAELRNFRNAFRHGRWSCWNPWFMIPKIVFCAWFLGSSLLHWPFQEEFGSLGSPFLSPQTKWPSESLVLFPGFRTVAGDSLPIHKISMRVTLSEFHFWECQAECEVRFPDLEGALCPAQSYTDKGWMTAIAT